MLNYDCYGHPLWQWSILLGITLALALATSFKFTKSQPIHFKYSLSALGFYQTISYLLMISNELVQLFEAIAFFTTIRPALLGLTVFALGNSLSEIVTNTSIARYSSPIIAITACYGGQVFSKLDIHLRYHFWCWNCIVSKYYIFRWSNNSGEDKRCFLDKLFRTFFRYCLSLRLL